MQHTFQREVAHVGISIFMHFVQNVYLIFNI